MAISEIFLIPNPPPFVGRDGEGPLLIPSDTFVFVQVPFFLHFV